MALLLFLHKIMEIQIARIRQGEWPQHWGNQLGISFIPHYYTSIN
jgi:hypothetical protein